MEKGKIKTKKILCLCGCGKYLTPKLEREKVPDSKSIFGYKYGKVIEITGYGYLGNNRFNTLSCGFRYACRITKKPEL